MNDVIQLYGKPGERLQEVTVFYSTEPFPPEVAVLDSSLPRKTLIAVQETVDETHTTHGAI